jgi:hypothetical protein
MRSGFSCFSKVALGALMSVLVVACSPELVHRTFKEAKQDFGPSRSDGILDLDEVKMKSLPAASSVRWQGDIDTASWYRASDDIGWLSRTLSIPILGHLSYRMREAVARPDVAWDHTFNGSAYSSAAIGETRLDTKKAIDDGVEMLNSQGPIIENLLANRSAITDWPIQRMTLVAVVGEIEKFILAFVRDVEKSPVDKAVKKQLVEELKINFGPKIQRIKAQVAMAYNEPKTYDFVAKVRAVLKDEEINLGPEIEKQLDLAERLPREVEAIKDSKSALSILVDFWLISSKEVRESKFKVMAPDLYDFFNGQSESDLQCIKTGCGFFTRIKKVLFILPQIDSYGIDKIRTQLSAAAEESIKSELELQSVQFLPSLHKEISAQILTELSRQKGNLTKISDDYGTYLRLVLNRVALAKLALKEKEKFAGAEPNRIRVDLDFSKSDQNSGRGEISVRRLPERNREGFLTGASAIGAGLAAAISIHDQQSETELTAAGLNPIRIRQNQARLYFEQINKVLMIGGYKTEAMKPFDAFAITIDGVNSTGRADDRPRFNLRDLMSSEISYAVPDRLLLLKPSRPELTIASLVPSSIVISVAGQAEMLRGLSRFAQSLRDWQTAPYDRVLGPVTLADFVPDLPRDAVDQKLFPKDLFFAAAVGNAGAILQNFTKKVTGVALIEPGGHLHWSDEKDPNQDPTKQAVMATAFDIVDGARALEARSLDVARLASSVCDFLRATEGIEKTRSEVLIKPGEGGINPVDELIMARQDLKLLTMAMANFLSSYATGPKGLILPTFTRSKENQSLGMAGEPRLLDQAVVIRALMDVSETIGAAIYRTAALDLMAATNQSFFRPALAFYSDRIGVNESPNLETLASLLIAGTRLAPHMSPVRAAQWSRVSRPWVNALRDAAETLP